MRPRAGEPGAAVDRAFLVAAWIGGAAVFALACLVLDALVRAGLYGPPEEVLWVRPYWQDAVAMTGGLLPYRDLPLEYPPLALPVFLLPALLPGGTAYPEYRTAFEVVMAICGVGVIGLVAATTALIGGRRGHVLLAVGVAAASPILAGPVVIARFDLWPALLAAAAVAALISGRHRTGHVALALATLAKVYPVLLGPLFVAFTWRRAGRREALVAAGIGVAVGLAGMLPFVALDSAGALEPFVWAVARPLQIESLGASVLIGLQGWTGGSLGHVTWSFGSYNFEGPWSQAAATIQAVLLAALLVAIWLEGTRGRPDAGRVAVACAATLCADVALGKVLSPQYVIWLIPAVTILVAVTGRGALVGLVGVLALTTLYYPGMYMAYVEHLQPSATLVVLGRDVGLLVLVGYLVTALRRGHPDSAAAPAAGAIRLGA